MWLQFLTHYTGYAQPKWSLLTDVNDLEALDVFFASDEWKTFFDSPEYRDWALAFPSIKPKR
jgi:hypothetical protein